MPVAHGRSMGRRVWAAVTVALILAAALCLRLPAFWTPHADPVEMAYVLLSMKLGTHPDLEGYHMDGVQIRRTELARKEGVEGGPIPILLPVEGTATPRGSFDAWPEDSNPFYFKPPLMPSLMTFSHHQLMDPKFIFYPVLASPAGSSERPDRSRSVWDVQAWAVAVPVIAGWTVVLLALFWAWRLLGAGTALITGAVLALHPLAVRMGSHIWPEALLTACLLAAGVVFQYFTSIRSWAGCLLPGLLFGLAWLTDASAVFALPAFYVGSVTAFLPVRAKGPWAAMLRLINPYFVSFLGGAYWIAACWAQHTQAVFGAVAWKRATAFIIETGSGGIPFLTGAVALGRQFPLLIAALFSPIFLIGASRSSRRPVLLAVWLVIGWIAGRFLYSPRAVWDERSFYPLLPVLTMLASWTILRFAGCVRTGWSRMISMRSAKIQPEVSASENGGV